MLNGRNRTFPCRYIGRGQFQAAISPGNQGDQAIAARSVEGLRLKHDARGDHMGNPSLNHAFCLSRIFKLLDNGTAPPRLKRLLHIGGHLVVRKAAHGNRPRIRFVRICTYIQTLAIS